MLHGLLTLALLISTAGGVCDGRVTDADDPDRGHRDLLLLCLLARDPATLPVDLGMPGDAGWAREQAEMVASSCRDLLESPDSRLAAWDPERIAPLEKRAETVSLAESSRWIRSCLDDVRAVSSGQTRAEIEQNFRQEGGIFVPRRQSFFHCRCRHVQVEISFEPVRAHGIGPGDVVVGVGPVRFDFARAD